MNFGERVDHYLRQIGATRKALTSDLDLAENSVALWVLRGTFPRMDTAVRVARWIGVPLDALCQDGPPVPPGVNEFVALLSRLTPDELADVREFILFKLAQK